MFDVAAAGNENWYYQSRGLQLQFMAKLYSRDYKESIKLLLQKIQMDSM